jgi:hypothetical protein
MHRDQAVFHLNRKELTSPLIKSPTDTVGTILPTRTEAS